MKATLLISHIVYDDEKSFQRFVPEEQKKDYNINMKLKIDSLNEAAKEVSEDIDKLIWNYSGHEVQTQSLNDYLKADKQFIDTLKSDENFDYLSEIKLEYDKNEELEKKIFSPIPVTIRNPKGGELHLGNLIEYYKSNCDFPCIIEIDLDNCSESGEEQFNTWVRLTRKLLSIPNVVIPMNEKIKRLPKKEFKFETINNYNTITKGYFQDCKLIEKISINKYALYVGKIIFVANNK